MLLYIYVILAFYLLTWAAIVRSCVAAPYDTHLWSRKAGETKES